MSKELVISTNSHETRVALLEDDQLVEIFFQRGSEYSLGGSIHKGRVTRVLPGMQSAFVNIGLDRDAFLYVSDFFDDSEEFDKVVSGVEEKITEMEAAARVVPAAALRESVVAAPVESAVEREHGPAPGPSGEQDLRDRRGRRSRRRRFRDRGFPESKYAAEPGTGAGEEEADTGTDEETTAYIPLLPGESLAKYGTSSRQQAAPRQERVEVRFDVAAADDETADRDLEAEPLDDAEAEEYGLVESAGIADDFPAFEAESRDVSAGGDAGEDAGGYLSEAVVELSAADVEPEPVPPPATAPPAGSDQGQRRGRRYRRMRGSRFNRQPAPEFASAPPAPGSASESGDSPAGAFEDSMDRPEDSAEPGLVLEAEIPEAMIGGDDSAGSIPEEAAFGEAADDELDGEAGLSAESASREGLEEPGAIDGEGPEPARRPHSLTATLREQGSTPRYLQQRTSRRLRKRVRRGGPEALPPHLEGRREEPRREEPRREESRREETRREEPREERVARTEEKPAAQPSISELLKEGQEILVQIAKEPLGQKGARITSHIALPGRYVVYMPTVEHIGVSRKIPSEQERTRLKRVLQANRGGIPGGFIVRTAGEGKTERQLAEDMQFLFNLWLDIRQKAEKKPAPVLLFHDLDVTQRVLRDYLTSEFKNVWVDSEEVYESVANFLHRFQPAMLPRLRLYTRKEPIFDAFNITAELEKALRPKIWLKSGGYIVINQTEALVAIDINTGKFVGKSNRLEDTIVKTNIEAVKEIIRQIRLRDLGGIIVVDFIDMDERKNRQKVMQALEEAMRADRAPSKVLQFNDFGLVAITRKRTKQSLERTLCEPCPYCEGSAYVKSVRTVIGEILEYARQYASVVEGKDVMLRTSPQVAKVIKSKETHYLEELEEILGRPVIVAGDAQLHQEKFDMA